MARISGVDIPRDKRVVISLTYIYGIGRPTASEICKNAGVSEDKRVIFSFFLCDSRIIILFYKFFAVIKPLFQINL